MEHNRLAFLLERHRQDTCSQAELTELEDWYDSLDANGLSFQEWVEQVGGEQAVAEELFNDFKNRSGEQNTGRRPRIFGSWLKVAAAFAGAVFLLGIGYKILNENRSSPAQTITFSAPSGANESRYFILPDGSRVLLHAGSKLDFDHTNKNTRTFSLNGEAYFDVKHNSDKPFVIHTGHLTTTVLGTEFRIKAYSGQDQITVSVSRGKVKVESQSKLLGILTQNQEIVYSNKSGMAKEQVMDEETTAAWTGAALEFESQSFKKIAEQLTKRYGLNIRFADPALEGCPITATFRGTETITEILDVITATRGATYSMSDDGKNILIDGDGCMM